MPDAFAMMDVVKSVNEKLWNLSFMLCPFVWQTPSGLKNA
jgi:hypothetical protein